MDEDGNIVIVEDIFMDDLGNYFDAKGRKCDEEGNLIDSKGNIIEGNDSQIIINFDNQAEKEFDEDLENTSQILDNIDEEEQYAPELNPNYQIQVDANLADNRLVEDYVGQSPLLGNKSANDIDFNAADNLLEQEKIVDELIKQMQDGNACLEGEEVTGELKNMVGELTDTINELETKSRKSEG